METTRLIVLVAMASMAASCSKNETGAASPPRTPSTAATAPASPPPQPAVRTACAMVTAAEMSTIVGTTVAAESEGKLSCTYQPAGQSMPYIRVEVAWGDGDVALGSVRVLGRLEPGIAERMAGLGDEATAIGPALWVRTGDDLVTLTLTGVDDHIAAAKRIIAVMRPRMGPSAAPRVKTGSAAGSSGDQASAGDSRSDDVAKAAQLVGGLLRGLAAEHDRSRASGSDAGGTANRVEPHNLAFPVMVNDEPVELRDIASALTHNPDWRIQIEGHTDNIGGDAFNLDLSRRRADAVKQALVDRHQVAATTLTTDGFGASRPDATNDTLSDRTRNRRVELVRQ